MDKPYGEMERVPAESPRPFDIDVTIRGEAAKREDTPEANGLAADRIDQVLADPTLTDLLSGGGPVLVETRTGRSGSGKLRNFRAMSLEKFASVYSAVIREDNDPEAIDAVKDEADARGVTA
jgi:hypothetical protein